MSKPIDVDALVKTNPRVNGEGLKRGLEAVKGLREAGIAGKKGYSIVPPFGGRLIPDAGPEKAHGPHVPKLRDRR